MIRLEVLNKKQLKNYIDSPEFYDDDFIPISKHRAISHINNPRADKEDILLILAYEDKKLIGYLGILPDRIFYDGTSEKIGWLSCIYVDSNQRGKWIAQKLVEKSFEVWNDNILLTEFTRPAKRLYDKIGKFTSMDSLNGIRLYLRSDLHKILPPKHTLFKKSKFLLKIFDSLFNTVFDLRYTVLKNHLNGLKIEYINEIDDESAEFISQRQSRQLFKRGKGELNWMLEFPWIISTPNDNCKKYHFSAIDKSFEFTAVKVFNEEKRLVAFVIFANRNDSLKIPYSYYDKIEDMISVINYHLIMWKIKTASIYNNKLATALKSSNKLALLNKSFSRNYLISTKFSKKIKADYIIQDGDGDTAFT